MLGAYPNRGHYEKPHWKFVDNITPSEYLEKAKSWDQRWCKYHWWLLWYWG